MVLKPILRRDHRNTSCRISSRTREGITPFPSETSTFVDRLDKLALSRNKFHYQIPGNRRLKFQKDSRRAHKPPTLPVIWFWENAERERERNHRQIGRRSVDPCGFDGNSIYPSLAHQCFRIRFLFDNLYFSDLPFIDHALYWSCLFGQNEMR